MKSFGRIACWGVPLMVGVTLAFSWVASGGFFSPGHDAYGEVSIPGQLTVELPAGPARLYVQERGFFGSKNDVVTIPSGIEANVQSAAGGAPVTLHSNTHAAVTTTDHVSWTTYASFDLPTAGTYRVTVLDPADNGDSRHTVTIGGGPWAPVPPWIFGLGFVAAATVIGFVADRLRLRLVARTPSSTDEAPRI